MTLPPSRSDASTGHIQDRGDRSRGAAPPRPARRSPRRTAARRPDHPLRDDRPVGGRDRNFSARPISAATPSTRIKGAGRVALRPSAGPPHPLPYGYQKQRTDRARKLQDDRYADAEGCASQGVENLYGQPAAIRILLATASSISFGLLFVLPPAGFPHARIRRYSPAISPKRHERQHITASPRANLLRPQKTLERIGIFVFSDH